MATMLKHPGRLAKSQGPAITQYPTAATIEFSKAEMQKERVHAELVAGVRIYDNGDIAPKQPFTMGCPFRGCAFQAHGRTDLSVVRSIGAHYKRAHLPMVQE